MAVKRALTMVIHGDPKVGKSTLASTAPKPTLFLDVEGGHRFLDIDVKYWDPNTEEPPKADGTWDTCVVMLRNWNDVLLVFKWLESGQHSFKSLVIDSISELQIHLQDQIVGRTEQMKMQAWGDLLRHMGSALRDIRNLTMHPTNPLEAIVLTAMSKKEADTNKLLPYLQGSISNQLPYLYDMVGALTVETEYSEDPTQPPRQVRRLYVDRNDRFEAGNRLQGRLGAHVEDDDLDIVKMLDRVFPDTAKTTE